MVTSRQRAGRLLSVNVGMPRDVTWRGTTQLGRDDFGYGQFGDAVRGSRDSRAGHRQQRVIRSALAAAPGGQPRRGESPPACGRCS